MHNSEDHFNFINNKLSLEIENVSPGKMMSSPGITYKGKVFAFYYNEKMVFRLERDFDIETVRISKFELLNPFKNKPPMKDWFVISEADQGKWEKLSNLALDEMKKKLNK